MKRNKLSFMPTELTAIDLEDLADTLLGEQSTKSQRVHIRRWRRLKQQLI